MINRCAITDLPRVKWDFLSREILQKNLRGGKTTRLEGEFMAIGPGCKNDLLDIKTAVSLMYD
tara:strand:- start:913 stop:1101 length:189 start_codon:yes stop_codon:yes gene_type:complete